MNHIPDILNDNDLGAPKVAAETAAYDSVQDELSNVGRRLALAKPVQVGEPASGPTTLDLLVSSASTGSPSIPPNIPASACAGSPSTPPTQPNLPNLFEGSESKIIISVVQNRPAVEAPNPDHISTGTVTKTDLTMAKGGGVAGLPPEVANHLEFIQAQKRFSADVRSYLTDGLKYTEDTIRAMESKYIYLQPNLPGAPLITELTDNDKFGVELISGYNPGDEAPWADIVARGQRLKQAEIDACNPYIPKFFMKAAGQLSPWMSEMAFLSDQERAQFASNARLFMPDLKLKDKYEVVAKPITRLETLEIILKTLIRYAKISLVKLGDTDKGEWTFSAMLCLLIGLGTDAVRQYFQMVDVDDPHAQFLATADDQDLYKEAIDASKSSGFPWVLLRVSFRGMVDGLKNVEFKSTPRWLVLFVLLHIVKHTRVSVSVGGEMFVVVTYNGRRTRTPIHESGCNQALSAKANKEVSSAIIHALGISEDAAPWAVMAVDGIFSVVTPAGLPKTIPLSERMDLAICPNTVFRQHIAPRSEERYIHPGLSVGNVAKINLDNGDVIKDYQLRDEDVIDLDIPEESPNEEARREWIDGIPDHVDPITASESLLGYFKNTNDLGNHEGLAALIDASVTVNLLGSKLIGCEVGRTVRKEKPLFMYHPDDTSLEGSTNCGKTLAAEVLGGVVMPGITAVYANTGTSAPAIRSMAKPLSRHGGAVYDEFYPAENPEHPFSCQGLQSLATGGKIAPGEALANADPICVKYNLHLTTKMLSVPPDILNRSVILYFSQLNDKTRLEGSILSEIKCGLASTKIRFAHQYWMHKNDILRKIHRMTLIEGIWRFDGHATIATMFAGRFEIKKYLADAIARSGELYANAVQSGLALQVTSRVGFSAIAWFHNLEESDLNELENLTKIHQGLKPLDVIVQLALANGHKDLASAERSLKTSTIGMTTSLGMELSRSESLVVGNYRIETSKKSGKTRVWIVRCADKPTEAHP